jgi:hypothetical protein
LTQPFFAFQSADHLSITYNNSQGKNIDANRRRLASDLQANDQGQVIKLSDPSKAYYTSTSYFLDIKQSNLQLNKALLHDNELSSISSFSVKENTNLTFFGVQINLHKDYFEIV